MAENPEQTSNPAPGDLPPQQPTVVPTATQPANSLAAALVPQDIDTTVATAASTAQLAQAPKVAKRISKKPFVIVGAVLLVGSGLFGGGALAYANYQKPENVLLQAIGSTLSMQKLRTKTSITSDISYGEGDEKIAMPKLVFETGVERSPSIDTNAVLSVQYGAKKIEVKTSALMTDAGDVYFKVSNAKDTIQKLLGDTNPLSSKAIEIIDRIDGKWAKYTLADLKKDSADNGKIAQCILDTYKKYKDDKKVQGELVEVYKANQFLVSGDNTKEADGNVGYSVTLDRKILHSYEKASKGTTVAKEVESCDPNSAADNSDSDDEYIDAEPSESDPVVTTTIWISKFSHKLRAIDVLAAFPAGVDDKPFTVTGRTDIIEGEGVTTVAPKDAMGAKQWVEDAVSFYEEVSGTAGQPRRTDQTELARLRGEMVVHHTYAYSANNRGAYPDSVAVFTQGEYSTVDDSKTAFTVVPRLPADENEVGYKRCAKGAQVVWWSGDGTYDSEGMGGVPSGPVTKLCD